MADKHLMPANGPIHGKREGGRGTLSANAGRKGAEEGKREGDGKEGFHSSCLRIQCKEGFHPGSLEI